MKFLIGFWACFLFAGFTLADDPGERDSVIVETVWATEGDTTVDVRIFVTTDDSVMYYNMPLAWHSQDSRINPSDVSYHNTLLVWDEVYDTTFQTQGYTRMLGWADLLGPDNPPILTNNYRMLCWTVHFSIDPEAVSQFVSIDTTYDPVNGSLLFGLIGGIESLTPVYIPGAIYYGIQTDAGDYDQTLPVEFALLHNYPNPFNASTTIEFTIPEEVEIELTIYDLLGREVTVLEKGWKPVGTHEVSFDATGLSSGVYFYRLRAGDAFETKRMVLLR